MAASVGIHIDADGFCHTDGVGHLHEHLVGNAGCHHVLGDVACGVCGTAIDLAGVFTGEGTASVRSLAAVGIDDDFASGQAGVAVRTSDNEFARRIDVVGDAVVEEAQHFGVVDGGDDARHQHFDDILADLCQHFLVGLQLGFLRIVGREDELVVLSGDHDGVDAHGTVVVVILDGDLTLGVGTEVGHFLALATDVGKHHQELVGEVEGQRHIVFGLVGGIAEHHTLVAGSLIHRVLALHAAVDVRTLFVDGTEHAAGVALEHVFALGVADAVDDLTGDALEVNVCFGLDFARHHDLSGGDEGFARHFRAGVEGEKLVEDGITDLVCHFVGVSFGHGFGCK